MPSRPQPAPRPEVLRFLQAIKENPEDDAPRLMLADWLSEHGDPRGDFIRCQLLLATLSESDSVHLALKKQTEDLQSRWAHDWIGFLKPHVSAVLLRRGLTQIVLDWDNVLGFLDFWKANAEEEAFAWIDGAYLDRITTGQALTWLLSRFSNQLNVLSIWVSSEWSDEWLRALRKRGALDLVTSLRMSNIGIRDEGLEQLANTPSLRRLVSLSLGGNMIRWAGVAALSRSAWALGLRDLELSNNPLGSEGAKALSQAPFGPTLQTLHLRRATLGSAGLAALLGRGPWSSLVELSLDDNAIDDEGIVALAGSPNLPALRTLKLAGNQIGNRGAIALAESPYLVELARLDLRGNPITAVADLHGRFGIGLVF